MQKYVCAVHYIISIHIFFFQRVVIFPSRNYNCLFVYSLGMKFIIFLNNASHERVTPFVYVYEIPFLIETMNILGIKKSKNLLNGNFSPLTKRMSQHSLGKLILGKGAFVSTKLMFFILSHSRHHHSHDQNNSHTHLIDNHPVWLHFETEFLLLFVCISFISICISIPMYFPLFLFQTKSRFRHKPKHIYTHY